MTAPKGPLLSKAEMASTTWDKLQARCTERLAAFRSKLENPNTPVAEREGLVYRIDELKEFLRLGTPAADK